MTADGSKEYWNMFQMHARYLPEREQRKIALSFCQLIADDLDALGKKAMKTVADLCFGKASSKKSDMYQKKLRDHLPNEPAASAYSVLIWSLMAHTSSYPTWYSAAIAGTNVVDLNGATYPELTNIVKKHCGFSDK